MADFKDIYEQVQGFVGDESADTLAKIKQWVNEGVTDIWTAHEWPFKRATVRVNTVAPYTTGTIDATKGSTTITSNGGDLTGLEGYKFATSISAPFFRIASVATGGATATLEAAFTETSVSASTFVIYKDEYDLGVDVESIESCNLLRASEQGMRYVSLDLMERYESLPSYSEIPCYYYLAAPRTGTTNIVLGMRPIPDAIYPIDVRYERKPTRMQADDDVPSLPDEFVPLIVSFALYKASLYDKAQFNSQVAYQDYQRSLTQKISQVQARTSADFKFHGFDAGGGNKGDQPWPAWY